MISQLAFEGSTCPALANNHLGPIKPTVVFDTYWHFAAERQSIFFKRFFREKPPWTSDRVLLKYKFTNAYRASDRVSQYLIRNVIYRSDLPATPDEVFFRIILFKTFNKISTWKLLQDECGPLTWEGYDYALYNSVLSEALGDGAIYSAAYIMASGRSTFGKPRKHQNHLRLIERMMNDEVPKKVCDSKSMQGVFDILLSYPTIGEFLAYQYATDINYSELTTFSEMDFVVPGPGALDGIRKCFLHLGGLNEVEIIKLMVQRQHEEFARLGLDFPSLWGRPLQLIDCQNLFCEVGKYSRIVHPECFGVSGRTRIKQLFQSDPEPIDYWYPPKWKLNNLIKKRREKGSYEDARLSKNSVGN